MGSDPQGLTPSDRPRRIGPLAADQAVADVVELLVVAVLDGEVAGLAGAAPHLDLQAQRIPEVLLERQRIGVLLPREAGLPGLPPPPRPRPARPLALALLRVFPQRLDPEHVEPAAVDPRRKGPGLLGADVARGGARRELAFADERLHVARQLQQAQRVADVAAAFAHDLG